MAVLIRVYRDVGSVVCDDCGGDGFWCSTVGIDYRDGSLIERSHECETCGGTGGYDTDSAPYGVYSDGRVELIGEQEFDDFTPPTLYVKVKANVDNLWDALEKGTLVFNDKGCCAYRVTEGEYIVDHNNGAKSEWFHVGSAAIIALSVLGGDWFFYEEVL